MRNEILIVQDVNFEDCFHIKVNGDIVMEMLAKDEVVEVIAELMQKENVFDKED